MTFLAKMWDEAHIPIDIQSLEDNELFDFWEETQTFSKVFDALPLYDGMFQDYEVLILQELQYRFYNRYARC
ncbi:MAG: hypothetical protein ACRCV3_03780 [Desulfovibrionaceae bacterium]